MRALRDPRLSWLSRLIVVGVGALERLQNASAPLSGTREVGRPLDPPVERSRPVVLVGGMGTDSSAWATWARSLQRDGFQPFIFQDPEYALGDVPTAARRLGEYVESVKARTGAPKVDLVGYSTGGNVIRSYVQLLGRAKDVGAAVVVATVNLGADDSKLLDQVGRIPLVGRALERAIPVGELEEQAGSPLMQALAATDGHRGGVPFTSIYSSRFDGINTPVGATYLPGAVNVPLNDDRSVFGLPLHDNHFGIIHWSAPAYESARAALLAAEDGPPRD